MCFICDVECDACDFVCVTFVTSSLPFVMCVTFHVSLVISYVIVVPLAIPYVTLVNSYVLPVLSVMSCVGLVDAALHVIDVFRIEAHRSYPCGRRTKWHT